MTAFEQLAGTAGIATLGRAHRIVLCEDGHVVRMATGMVRSRIGILPRLFDVEAFAGALAWLAAR